MKEQHKVKKTFFCKAKNERERIKLEHIYGPCLEEIGLVIPNGAVAVIDRNANPKIGDLVHCNDWLITINGYIKQVQEVGEVFKVGTAYKDKSKDFSFEALEMYGVVLMVVDYDGNIVYQRNGGVQE